MRSARITSREAVEALFPLVDDSISTVAREEEMRVERAEIDALVEEMECEWVSADVAESFRVSRDMTDQVRARRAHRRAARVALRSLPVRVADLGDGEAA
jgi:hypothetical protein